MEPGGWRAQGVASLGCDEPSGTPAYDAEADALLRDDVLRIAGAAGVLEVEGAQPATAHAHLGLQRAVRGHRRHKMVLEAAAAHEAVTRRPERRLHAVAAAREDAPARGRDCRVLEVHREGELGGTHAW